MCADTSPRNHSVRKSAPFAVCSFSDIHIENSQKACLQMKSPWKGRLMFFLLKKGIDH